MSKQPNRWAAMALALLCASTIVLGPMAADSKTFKLTAISGIPPIALSMRVTTDFFMPEVNKRLEAAGSPHRIEWTGAWAGSVAKLPEVFESVENGIGHLGVQVWPFEGSKLPLENMTFHVPFGTNDPVQLVNVFRKVREQIPEMESIFHKYNQVLLASWALDPDQLAAKEPIKSLKDLQGMKIGASGTMALYFQGTGAVPVSSSMNQAVTAIKSGVYEGYPAPITLMFAYRMHESAPHITTVSFGATVASGLTINKDAWDSLPADVQKIMRDVGWETAMNHSAQATKLGQIFRGKMAEQGAKFHDFPAEERKRWATSLPNIAKQWAKRLEEQGLPGNKALKTYMNELRALPNSDQFLVRHWDRE